MGQRSGPNNEDDLPVAGRRTNAQGVKIVVGRNTRASGAARPAIPSISIHRRPVIEHVPWWCSVAGCLRDGGTASIMIAARVQSVEAEYAERVLDSTGRRFRS